MSFLRTAQQAQQIKNYVNSQFNSNIIPSLMDYVRIPNISPMYDKEWLTNGYLNKAAEHLRDWTQAQGLKGLTAEVIQDEGKPPLVFVQVEATDNSNKSILFYGHYDKQPHFTGWMEGTGPTTPVIIKDRMYGRGCSDDGYSIYAAISAIKTCQNLGFPHPRCLITIEGEEESGSGHYMNYLEKLNEKIKTPDFLICLDSGCGNYDTMWLTTSLRGNIKADISVKVLTEGVHSGGASGIVPSSFRILRNLLDRIEDSKTGLINPIFHSNIPAQRYSQACEVANDIGKDIINKFPYIDSTEPMSTDPLQAYLNKSWRPQLALVGADGLPELVTAGNVLLPDIKVRLSLRLPPNLDAQTAANNLKQIIEADPPHKATVECKIMSAANGWDAKESPAFLSKSLEEASLNFFKQSSRSICEGGSIPLMTKLQQKFPEISFVVTGVLGPHSNAHGPNEMLDLPFTENLISCLSQIVADTSAFYQNKSE